MPKASKAKLDYIAQYEAENTRQYRLRLSVKNDADIIEKLDSVPNKIGYLKELIREDLKKG